MKLLYRNVFLELLYMDTNKSWTDHSWDNEITNFGALATEFRQVAINNAKHFQIILIVDILQLSKFRIALEEALFRDIETLTWVKSDVHQVKSVPPNQRYVKATETILTARSPAKGASAGCFDKINFQYEDNNPKRRYDFFMGPDKDDLQKYRSSILNKYEKPEWLSSYLAKPYVKQGDTALVFGGGAGGDVAGLLDIGLNVVCLENDNLQYYGLLARFEGYRPSLPKLKPKTMYDIQRKIPDFWDSGSEDDDVIIVDERAPSKRNREPSVEEVGDQKVVDELNGGNIGQQMLVMLFL